MNTIVKGNKKFVEYIYKKESEFEKDIIKNSKELFGNNTYYIDIKKLIKSKTNSGTIPDGYLLDCTYEKEPKLYIVENELKSHSIKEHIAPQLTQFYFNYRGNFQKIKGVVIKCLEKEEINIDNIAINAGFRNADDMLTHLIYNEEIRVIIPIDEVTEELNSLKKMFRFNIEIKQFKKYISEDNEELFVFETFHEEIEKVDSEKTESNELDTVIVPAEEEGFQKVFLNENCWYAISIGINMLDKLKYIAVYRKSPIKAITHIAEISYIDVYKDTGKYIIYLKKPAEHLKMEIPLNPNNISKAPQGRVYTNINKILNATPNTTMDDLF